MHNKFFSLRHLPRVCTDMAELFDILMITLKEFSKEFLAILFALLYILPVMLHQLRIISLASMDSG